MAYVPVKRKWAVPDDITASEARFSEALLALFLQQLSRQVKDPAMVLGFVRLLATWNTFDAERGLTVCSKLLTDPNAACSMTEFLGLLVRLGYGTMRNRKTGTVLPSYVKLNEYVRCTRQAYRMAIRREANGVTYMPYFKDLKDVECVLGMLQALQAFDSLGMVFRGRQQSGPRTVVKWNFRRMYPFDWSSDALSTGQYIQSYKAEPKHAWTFTDAKSRIEREAANAESAKLDYTQAYGNGTNLSEGDERTEAQIAIDKMRYAAVRRNR